MSDDQIKEIIIALINKNQLFLGDSNYQIGRDIAELYKALKEGIKSDDIKEIPVDVES